MKSVFISYSWEDDEHNEWVRNLATCLRQDGIDASIDQWEVSPGDQLPEFMEKSIRDNDYVLVVCTPTYKLKSDNRTGGVGYEGDIITSEIFGTRNNRKFIPLLRKGSWKESAPSWLFGKYYLDLTNFPNSKTGYNDLESTINEKRLKAPPIGKVKTGYSSSDKKINKIVNEAMEDVRIIGVIADEVTMPKNDGSRGSALYKVPFRLTKTPSTLWKELFIKSWNNPPSFTTMHRPGIASVSGSKIYLTGTTIEEVKKYHRDTLILAVNEANRIEKEYQLKKRVEEKKKQEMEEKHRKSIGAVVNEIEF